MSIATDFPTTAIPGKRRSGNAPRKVFGMFAAAFFVVLTVIISATSAQASIGTYTAPESTLISVRSRNSWVDSTTVRTPTQFTGTLTRISFTFQPDPYPSQGYDQQLCNVTANQCLTIPQGNTSGYTDFWSGRPISDQFKLRFEALGTGTMSSWLIYHAQITIGYNGTP